MFRLRHIEATQDRKNMNILHLTVNQTKSSPSFVLCFDNNDICISAKKLVEAKRKESKIKEFNYIKNFIQQEDLEIVL